LRMTTRSPHHLSITKATLKGLFNEEEARDQVE
jgi:hypothetical protein